MVISWHLNYTVEEEYYGITYQGSVQKHDITMVLHPKSSDIAMLLTVSLSPLSLTVAVVCH